MFSFIVDLIARSGYFGIFFLMALENIFPPIPSEMIMPFAGYVAASGKLHVIGVLIAGTAGSVAGALPWYIAGRKLGQKGLKKFACKHGRWLTLSARQVDRAADTFKRHGEKAVLFGRLIPAVRTLISVPAGIARMRTLPFLAYSTMGSLAWTALLVGAGFLLEQNFDAVANYVEPVSKAVFGVIAAIYLYRLVTHKSEEEGAD